MSLQYDTTVRFRAQHRFRFKLIQSRKSGSSNDVSNFCLEGVRFESRPEHRQPAFLRGIPQSLHVNDWMDHGHSLAFI
jgi:hypothetical protein